MVHPLYFSSITIARPNPGLVLIECMKITTSFINNDTTGSLIGVILNYGKMYLIFVTHNPMLCRHYFDLPLIPPAATSDKWNKLFHIDVESTSAM